MSSTGLKSWNHWRMDGAGIAVVLGLTAIAYFGQISPTLQNNELAKAQTIELAAQQAKSRELERSVRSSGEKLQADQQAVANNALQLEPASALNQRLARLTDLAGENHLVVDTIESGETRDYDRYSTVSIRLAGRGSYRSCETALSNLRRAMPDVGVVSMQLTSAGVNTDTAAVFVFELLWHTQPATKSGKR